MAESYEWSIKPVFLLLISGILPNTNFLEPIWTDLLKVQIQAKYILYVLFGSYVCVYIYKLLLPLIITFAELV